jgi:hypothetical protein
VDRLTKIVVLAWIGAAIVFQIWVQTPGFPHLPLLSAIVAVVSVAVGFFDPRFVAGVLAISYSFPVLIRSYFGGAPYAPNEIVWITALVGVLLPSVVRTSWHIPVRWRGALVAAALVVVVTSPIVWLREMDLNPGLLRDRAGWSFGGGLWPSLPVTWSLYSSLTLVVGIVWFDWLCSARDLDFRRYVVTPLAFGASVVTLVLIYQLFVDVGFLNDTVFGVNGRAGGTMYDANLSGTVAALWLGGLVVLALRSGRYAVPLTIVGVLANSLAVWASGSRTAFMVAFIVTISAAIGLLLKRGVPGKRSFSMTAGVAALLVVFLVLAARGDPRLGPLRRFSAMMPTSSSSPARDFMAEMWNRNGYGAGATAMLADYPFFGIGVGTFQSVVGDYVGGLPPDNAQNWIRHQVVEFGVIGSVGWMIWLVMFGIFVFRFRPADSMATWITRGMLIGFGVISFLGVPGQDVTVAITLWTIAFWYMSLVEPPAKPVPMPRWMSAAAVAVAIVCAVGTAELATTRLRVPERAMRHAWPYSYGFASTFQSVAGEDGYRRSRSHAVAVLDAPSRWLSVSVRADAGTGDPPMDVRVWADGQTVLKAQLTPGGPLTAVVQLPDQSRRVLLEAAGRPLGSDRPFFVRSAEPQYFLKWEFLDRPPANFNGAGYLKPFSS